MFYSMHSEANIDYLIEERIKYAQSQKAENKILAKDPNVNVSSTASQNYESINVDTELTHESVDNEYIEESNSNSDSEKEIQILDLDECEIIDEIDFRGLEQIPHAMEKES